jgi:hypothetical protein
MLLSGGVPSLCERTYSHTFHKEYKLSKPLADYQVNVLIYLFEWQHCQERRIGTVLFQRKFRASLMG